jgi:tetratricopeptide (TPR) repeat protein
MIWSSILALILLAPSADDPPVTVQGDPLADAKALRDQEQWAEAGSKFREALEKEPDGPVAPEARFWAGFCLEKLDEHKDASQILKPFETTLAENTWADDALLQLGLAYLGNNDKSRAVAVWNRQLAKYPDSVWRLEVMLKLVDLYFYHLEDFPACLAASERAVGEFPDREGTTEARYAGAYCLNVLRRFADAEAWTEKNFDPESPLEEAWRRVLGAQRDLLRGKVEQALEAVGSLDRDFPDLDQGNRQDLKLRTTHMLRYNGRADRARQLLLDELAHSSGRPEDEVVSLLDELSEIIGDDRPADFSGTLARLVDDPASPMIVRVAARERRARLLVEMKQFDPAIAFLQLAIDKDTVEYARVRAALALVDLLDEPPTGDEADPKLIRRLPDRAAASKVLAEILPTIGRRDLAHQVRKAAEKYQTEEPRP